MKPDTNRVGRVTFTLLFLAVPIVGFWQRWNIYDAWRLRGYTPPAKVVMLANETTVNEKSRRLFYVNRPSLDTKETFRQHCTSGEKTIVLGCFISYKGIFLQEINDDRLAGIMQVTAAHEILHAAYERLSMSDKNHIGGLIEAHYASLKNDRIKETIEDYKKNGADITNELHSILATEVRNLPPELEVYYKRYFVDRSKVVDFSERYEAAFTSRKQKVADYEAQLAVLKQQIDGSNSELESQQKSIEARQAELNRLLAEDRVNEYNAAVPGFNGLVSSYNGKVAAVRGMIDRYNQIVKERNEIALEEGELVKAIDSRPTIIKKQ